MERSFPLTYGGCWTEFKSNKKSKVSLVAANLGLSSVMITVVFLTDIWSASMWVVTHSPMKNTEGPSYRHHENLSPLAEP